MNCQCGHGEYFHSRFDGCVVQDYRKKPDGSICGCNTFEEEKE